MKYHAIVIGAGAAGLSACIELTKAGKRVLVLEARGRIGGRIYTLHENGFNHPTEAGAEFIHGDLPLTTTLFKTAGINYTPMAGDTYQIRNGALEKNDFFEDEWQVLIKELQKLETDMTFEEFLKQKFPFEKHQSLHSNIKKFVEGYNAADSHKASALALREEWLQEEDPTQYRPEGGYGKLADLLLELSMKKGLEIQLSKIVTHIEWNEDGVIVKIITGEAFSAQKALVTVPIGVLRAEKIKFEPPLPSYLNASKNIGFGSVIKFLFQFSEPFWQNNSIRKMPSLKFLFTDATIPTWWSQLPHTTPVLTGWLGGPVAEKLNNDEGQLFSMAIDSLSYIFRCETSFIRQKITAFHIYHWKYDPFSCGAYSYATVETASAKKLLNTPMENVLYFAGEGLYDGPHTGTVEAALSSGKETARKMLLAS